MNAKQIIVNTLFVIGCAGLAAHCLGVLLNFDDGIPTNALHADFCYFILRYILSFPLGILTWFDEQLISLAFWFAIPNALIMANLRSIWRWIFSSGS